jgi:hypothetical protein
MQVDKVPLIDGVVNGTPNVNKDLNGEGAKGY